MLYRIFISYIRFKLLKLVLDAVRKSKLAKTGNGKGGAFLTYLLELGLTYFLESRSRRRAK
ncbi:hypothetical protein [Legionella jordanis]|uniref:Uncharacterized protein n=1 Tax=Legionella jordanis TaxID=456 RepID=A0A0W0V845_9GAMM|nr:hypothetical protein [Legionella jordanis]KTD16291.1 hypothetical protein Ljor_0597 [Legionella jordanis]RMX04495.1 hypothetical protein EAW55_03415 [Legionella jordanis]RMX21042.1 hypothetical protein EAS68_04870 [Legionella jordanis]VEH12252.1 Uncharacterised protein [Legionella jordanis]HAT8713462.1 hypothetical protein [Legionella jordanis]